MNRWGLAAGRPRRPDRTTAGAPCFVPEGSGRRPAAGLLSNIYMRRFILGWKTLGHARRFGAQIANYADDFRVCGRAPAKAMRAAVEGMMERLRLPVNARKTRCMRVPEEP